MNSHATAIEPLSWSGDLMKDTFTYRFIDISATLLDLVMENQSVADHYMNWIDEQDTDMNAAEEAARGLGATLKRAAAPSGSGG